MPEPIHPPYAAGAVSVPRQLNRWLDINAQNGPLTRSRLYLTISSFSANELQWIGVSDLIAVFNFECQNNFSLKCNIALPPSNLPIAYNVVNIPGNNNDQTGSVVGTQGGGALG